MARDHPLRVQGDHLVQRITPLLTTGRRLGVGGPEMHTPRHAGAAEDRFVRPDPDERRVVMRLHDGHFLAIDGKAVGLQRLRDIHLRRARLSFAGPSTPVWPLWWLQYV